MTGDDGRDGIHPVIGDVVRDHDDFLDDHVLIAGQQQGSTNCVRDSSSIFLRKNWNPSNVSASKSKKLNGFMKTSSVRSIHPYRPLNSRSFAF
jgi:hypothetical protein